MSMFDWFKPLLATNDTLNQQLTIIQRKLDTIMAQIDDLTAVVQQVSANNDQILTDLATLEAQAPPNLQPAIDALKATVAKQSDALSKFPTTGGTTPPPTTPPTGP